MMLAAPTWVFGPHALWPARLLSLVLSLGVIALTVTFVRRLAGDRAAAVAGCLVAVMPSLIANDTITLTEPLALLLVLALLIFLDRRAPIPAGLVCGLLLLTRPNAYLVVVVMAITLWATLGWRKAGLSVCVSVLVLAPWLIRNQVQVNTLHPTTSDGFNLAAIYAPPARSRGGFVDPVFDPWYSRYHHGAYKYLQFDEAAWNNELEHLAVTSIRRHPAYVAVVVRRNIESYFELDPNNNRSAEHLDGRNWRFRAATLPAFYALLAAGNLGLALSARNRRLWPALALLTQFVALSLLLVAPPRLRSPLDLMLCIGAGLLAGQIADRRGHRPLKRPLRPSGQWRSTAASRTGGVCSTS